MTKDFPEPTRVDGDAASAVVVRDGPAGLEVLMLRRLDRGSFAGAWVFPGGYVDPEDTSEEYRHDAAASWGADVPVREVPAGLRAAARAAAVRETEEETGLLLDSGNLVPLTCWVPPVGAPKRMRAWYFLAPLTAGADAPVRLSPGEHAEAEWLTPADALARHGAGEMLLVPPTWVTLHELATLAGSATVADAVAAAEARASGGSGVEFEAFRSQQFAEGGRKYVLWHGDAGWEDELAAAGHGPHLPGAPPTAGTHRLDVTDLPWTYEREL
ncbi:NUDIX hydrolase [Zhihengliuella halotolerans]|uniref:ADP-ribose pyrophosphatase YjhB (NUDIX family) n=1 Tax=Zhihengliuella halotolerans TaxID=370736 RepID=A0A4Q8AF55_9MICC|nr:NUDIX hydrolase [Zhihengliuella halotolerans]RZU62932.1 ADP-ribose pyrophosphatase YjhB (NUDIX family) [Zhihengliuella halotolerans]